MTSSSFPRGNLTGWRPPPIACSLATPTARRRKRSASGANRSDSHLPLEVGVDEVRAAVYVVEDLRHAEHARAVADPQAEISLAKSPGPEEIADAKVYGWIEVLQLLRGVAVAPRLVPRLHEGHALSVGDAAAEADARAHALAPGESPVERLQVEIDLQEVRLQPALLVAQQPSVPGDGDRPAVRRFDERPSDLEGIDAGAIVRADRPAAQFHDRQQVAIAGPAVQDLEGERKAVSVVFDRSRSEFVGKSAESGDLHSVLHDGAAAHAARPQCGGDAGEKMPAVGEVIPGVQAERSVDAAARLVGGAVGGGLRSIHAVDRKSVV